MEFPDIERRLVVLGGLATGALAALGGASAETLNLSADDHSSLIARMTLEEKAGQLNLEGLQSPTEDPWGVKAVNPIERKANLAAAVASHKAQLARIRAGQVGMVMSPLNLETLRLAQQTAVKESRLGIPLLCAADVIHGYHTVFPVPVAEAASFEPALARRTSRASAIEASAAGHDLTYAPMVDIARDQRWGRVVEGAGEDVLLGSLFAAARVEGFQGSSLSNSDSLLVCPKHFAAYGAAEAGVDYAGAPITERILHSVYLPPFAAAYKAGAMMTMVSFNTIDGVPNTGSRRLLTGILRDELGFQGAVVSDFESEKELVKHGFAADERDAARLALLAGCDISMISGIYLHYLPELVRAKLVPMEVLDRAVARMLRVKAVAGLFDDPFRRMDGKRNSVALHIDAHRPLAREAAVKSIVLLKNDGGLLPLAKSGQRIALIGPFASGHEHLNGPWSPPFTGVNPVTLEAGIKSAMHDPNGLLVVLGSDIESPLVGGIAAAVAAAQSADVVVLAIGESNDMSGESSSRAEIIIPEAQQALAEAVAATGKPVVVLLKNGRALALKGAVRDARAILVGWFLGTESGNAVADILFGDSAPSGRLPMSFPIVSGQEPYYYCHESSGRPSNSPTEPFTSHLIGIPNQALYPFGHGLTYGDLHYGATMLDSKGMAWNGRIEVTATIANHGQRAADETVQLYIHDRVASVVQPIRLMKAFRKVHLDPNEKQTVHFDLNRSDLEFLTTDLKRIAEPGMFDVWVSPSAATGTKASFELLSE
jgi:beta-glucosidase